MTKQKQTDVENEVCIHCDELIERWKGFPNMPWTISSFLAESLPAGNICIKNPNGRDHEVEEA